LVVQLGACSAASPSTSPTTERIFGKVTEVNSSTAIITVNLSEFFTGDAATEAARRDGAIGPTDTVPNGVYIRDLHSAQSLAVVPSATVEVLGYDAEGNPAPLPYDVPRLAAAVTAHQLTGSWSGLYWTDYFWLDTVAGNVVHIEAQYLP